MVDIVQHHLLTLLGGLGLSLEITGVGVLGAFVLGSIIAIFRISPIAPLRTVGLIYVEVFRNIPMMSLIILVVYALPKLNIMFGFLRSVFVAMILVGASFVCEALRSGVNAVGSGQIEAGRAVGLTFVQLLRHVVMPQAFRTVVQPLLTVVIGIFLSSSLAGVVGIMDLTQTANRLNTLYAFGLLIYIVAAVFYVAVALVLAWLGGRIERAVRIVR